MRLAGGKRLATPDLGTALRVVVFRRYLIVYTMTSVAEVTVLRLIDGARHLRLPFGEDV